MLIDYFFFDFKVCSLCQANSRPTLPQAVCTVGIGILGLFRPDALRLPRKNCLDSSRPIRWPSGAVHLLRHPEASSVHIDQLPLPLCTEKRSYDVGWRKLRPFVASEPEPFAVSATSQTLSRYLANLVDPKLLPDLHQRLVCISHMLQNTGVDVTYQALCETLLHLLRISELLDVFVQVRGLDSDPCRSEPPTFLQASLAGQALPVVRLAPILPSPDTTR